MPIETAPKDGRFVILHVHGAEPEVSIGFYDGGPDWLFVEGDIMPTECRPLFWQPLPEPPTPQNHLQHKDESMIERCGCTLQYTLTDYGAEQEASYWLESPVAVMNGETSYGLDRLALNLYHGMKRKRLLMICAVVGQTYRTFKGAERHG